MKSKHLTYLLIIIFCSFLFLSCADKQVDIQSCLNGHVYGFWGGLWHGIISPFSFIYSLFNDETAVWAINNNGNWYTFGFLLGTGSLFTASTKK